MVGLAGAPLTRYSWRALRCRSGHGAVVVGNATLEGDALACQRRCDAHRDCAAVGVHRVGDRAACTLLAEVEPLSCETHTTFSTWLREPSWPPRWRELATRRLGLFALEGDRLEAPVWIGSEYAPNVFLRHCRWSIKGTVFTEKMLSGADTTTFDWALHSSLAAGVSDLGSALRTFGPMQLYNATLPDWGSRRRPRQRPLTPHYISLSTKRQSLRLLPREGIADPRSATWILEAGLATRAPPHERSGGRPIGPRAVDFNAEEVRGGGHLTSHAVSFRWAGRAPPQPAAGAPNRSSGAGGPFYLSLRNGRPMKLCGAGLYGTHHAVGLVDARKLAGPRRAAEAERMRATFRIFTREPLHVGAPPTVAWNATAGCSGKDVGGEEGRAGARPSPGASASARGAAREIEAIAQYVAAVAPQNRSGRGGAATGARPRGERARRAAAEGAMARGMAKLQERLERGGRRACTPRMTHARASPHAWMARALRACALRVCTCTGAARGQRVVRRPARAPALGVHRPPPAAGRAAEQGGAEHKGAEQGA